MDFTAPAKINLNLRILARRADGFHDIETLILPIPLEDRLAIDKSSAFRFSCSDSSLPLDDTNLVVRAVRAFEAATNASCAVRIHLEKAIPHGAGLGGGSSDAAATLIALDRLFDTCLSRSHLAALAADLGSDVPAFLERAPVICTGRGEIVRPAPAISALPLMLVKPAFAVSTPWAYQHWAASRQHPECCYAPQSLDGFTLVNDLERPVFEKFLLLPVIKSWFLDQPEVRAALMSGSGSTMFAILKSAEAAPGLEARFREEIGGDFWFWTGCSAPASGSR